MRVPRYWEKESAEITTPDGHRVVTGCWGWSESSPDEARQKAVKAAKRLADRLLSGNLPPQHYGYDERLPREEIIDEFTDENGVQAVVTRNAYGSLVLNTRDLMFIDVDFPPLRPTIPMPGFLRKLFGQPEPVRPEDRMLDNIRSAASHHPELSFRLYRTRNGYRVMVVSRPISAQSDEARQLLNEFNADPLYRRMCKNQECFRARLTPKAWRCDAGSPPARYPFESPQQESAYREWEKQYLRRIDVFSTCDFVETIGDDRPAPSLTGLIELHDKLTRSSEPMPLA